MSQIDGTGAGAASAKSPAKTGETATEMSARARWPEHFREVSDDLTDFLVANREEEIRAQEELRRLRDERAELLATAHAYGLNMSAMARAAGVTRETAYALERDVTRRREEFEFRYDPFEIMRNGGNLRRGTVRLVEVAAEADADE